MKRTASFSLLVVLVSLSACPATKPPTADVAANWNGTINLPGSGGASLLTLSLEGSGTEIEGVAVIGPVSDAGELGLLDGEVEQNSVKLDFAILESGGAALYSLAGQVEDNVMRGEATRRSLHGKTKRGTFEVTRER